MPASFSSLIFFCIGHTVFGSHHPCNAGTDQKERGICRSGRIRDSALRHHSPVRQHTENRSLRTGIDDDAGNTVRLPLVCRIHLHAGHHNDSRSGGSGRSYHGLSGNSAIHARLRRIGTGFDDRALHRNGQFRHSLQRDGRRSYRFDYRQNNGEKPC